MGYPPSISHRTTPYVHAWQQHSWRGRLWFGRLHFRWTLQRKTEGGQFVHLPFHGGVLEEVLYVQFDDALVWSSRLAVHNAELRGVVVLRDGFTGIVHVVTQCQRPPPPDALKPVVGG